MVANIGDIVRLKENINEYKKGELFRVTEVRESKLSKKTIYNLIGLKNNEFINGLYTYRFEIYKNTNKDMY